MGGSVSTLRCGGGDSAMLMQAADSGDASRVRQVLEARPDMAGWTGVFDRSSAMHRAAAGGHLGVLRAIVESLRAYGAGVTDPSKGDHKERSFASVERYLAEVINQRAAHGQTPLMLACANGHLECVKFLLSEDADPFLVDRAHLRTALHCAAAYGHAPVLRALLADDLVVETAGERVPLRNARVRDMSGVCRYIDTRAEGGVTALHLAALSGTLACVQLLLEAGASMMVRTVSAAKGSQQALGVGSTPLHAAAFRGDLGIVQAMLQAHADAMGRWNSGAAAGDGQREWENDGRVDLRSVTSATRQLPYHLARQQNHRHILRILNPTVSIDAALEDCRDNESGFGPQKLSTLASYALRQGLLGFLQGLQAQKAQAAVAVAVTAQAQAVAAAGLLAPESPGAQPCLQDSPQSTETQHGKQQAVGKLPAGVSITATAGPAAQQEAGSSPQQEAGSLPILPRVRGPGAGPQASPPAIGPVAEVPHSLPFHSSLPQQQSSHPGGGGSAGSSVAASREASPAQGPPNNAPAVQPSAKSVLSRHTHFAATLPARFTGFAHGAAPQHPGRHHPGQPHAGRPASAAGGVAGVGHSRQRRSSPGHLDTHPQSAPLGLATPEIAPGRIGTPGGILLAATTPLPQGRLRTGSAGLTLERPPWSGTGSRTGHSATAGRGGWRQLLWRHDGADDLASIASSGDGDVAGTRRLSHNRGILRTFSNLAKRIVHAEGGAGREVAIAGFEERPPEPSECGICLDALEEVAVNGCSHRLCVNCALSLCEIHKKPPLCPFCRLKIQGFHVVV